MYMFLYNFGLITALNMLGVFFQEMALFESE